MATLGMFILWMGWFGFNGGSELKIANVEEANAVAKIFVNTNAAAAAGMVVAALFARFLFGKTDLTMTINGALAGLVAITAEPLQPFCRSGQLDRCCRWSGGRGLSTGTGQA